MDEPVIDAPLPEPPGLFRGEGGVGADLAAVDWDATPLGTPQRWSQSLRSAVTTVLRSRFSMWMAWGPDLTFFCNEAYRRDTLAAKYPWALGRPASEVWSEIWPDIGPRIEKVMRTGEATWDEALLLFLERSGYREETYHTFSYSPLTDEDGTVAGMLCVVIEDTERIIGSRRMATLQALGTEVASSGSDEAVLRSAAATLAVNAQDVPYCLLYTLDEGDGTATLVAGAGAGAGAGGRGVAADLVDLADPDAPWPLARAVSGSPVLVPRPARTTSGVDPVGDAIVLPLLQPGRGVPAGFLVAGLNPYRPLDAGYRSFLDLVAGQVASRLAAARAYEAERERAEQLAALDQAKTTFFTNVSHEFRTPLTLLLGPIEEALGDTVTPLPPAQRARAEVVQRNGVRLLTLVNTLLDFSRLESGRVEPRFEPTDLSRYTAELASAFASAVERAGLVFEVDCPPLPGPVRVDRDLWPKVVFNLLSNALKFTFEGSIAVRIGVAGDCAELTVVDTGIGIAPEDQTRLFDRFYRAEATRARTHEGSGIGLALVAELAELHGGSATVSSAPGAGSRFTVRLPLGGDHVPGDLVDPAAATPDDGATPPAPAGWTDGLVLEARRWVERDAASPTTASASGPDRPRVLVIDDNEDMRGYIAGVLADGYAVSMAADGVSGADAARRSLPDLVITDVMMPHLDGFGLLRALRADPATEHLPVILLSARAGEDSTAEGLEAGADDYLIKPFTARELLARVRSNLELDRSRRVHDRLVRSQALLDQSQRIAHIGSWDLDPASGSMEASDELLRQLGTTPSELRSGGLRAMTERVHPDDVGRLLRAVDRSVEARQPFDEEVRIRTPDGERTYRVLAEVVEEDGQVRLRGANQDVTDQRASERAVAAGLAAREVAAREHRIADELQRSLIPTPGFDPDSLSIATYYRAGVEGTQVGGDWYDVIDLGAGRTALVLGDVMGRGVRAAAVMGQLRAAIRAYTRLDLPPDDVLGLLDSAVRNLGEDQIVTCVYAVYDPGDETLSYANAGHMPPLLVRPGAAPVRLVGASGPPLGIGPIECRPEVVTLPPGSTLLLYTDGLIERRGTNVEDGIARLVAAVGEAEGPVAALPGRLVEQLLPEGPDDDVAVLVARCAPASSDNRVTTFVVAAEASAVSTARRTVSATLREWGVDDAVEGRVVLAASEMVTNAIIHGRAPVEVSLRVNASDVVLQVRDGASSLPRRMRPSADSEHGRGLQIIEQLADRWGIRPTPSGKAVWCVLRRDDGSRPTREPS